MADIRLNIEYGSYGYEVWTKFIAELYVDYEFVDLDTLVTHLLNRLTAYKCTPLRGNSSQIHCLIFDSHDDATLFILRFG